MDRSLSLDQPNNLLRLLQRLEEHNIGIMLYTGYEHEEIVSDPLLGRICEIPDIMVIGRYRAEERDINLTWRGSKDQSMIVKGRIEMPPDANHAEIRINEDGSIMFLGHPDEFLSEKHNGASTKISREREKD